MRAAALVRSAAERTLVVENVACGNFPHAQVVGLSVLQEADGIAVVKAEIVSFANYLHTVRHVRKVRCQRVCNCCFYIC